MTPAELEEAVQRVIDAIAPEYRERTSTDVAALRADERLSWDGLLATIADPAAGEQRQRAAWLVGRLGAEAGLAPLTAALTDDDPRLREEVARALGSLADARAIAPLADALRHDGAAAVREAAASALGLIGEDAVVDVLLEALADPAQPPSVRGQAAESLIAPRDPRAIPPLIEALSDPAPEVRYWCAFALGELGAEEALPALERLAATDTAEAGVHGLVADEARAAITAIRG